MCTELDDDELELTCDTSELYDDVREDDIFSILSAPLTKSAVQTNKNTNSTRPAFLDGQSTNKPNIITNGDARERRNRRTRFTPIQQCNDRNNVPNHVFNNQPLWQQQPFYNHQVTGFPNSLQNFNFQNQVNNGFPAPQQTNQNNFYNIPSLMNQLPYQNFMPFNNSNCIQRSSMGNIPEPFNNQMQFNSIANKRPRFDFGRKQRSLKKYANKRLNVVPDVASKKDRLSPGLEYNSPLNPPLILPKFAQTTEILPSVLPDKADSPKTLVLTVPGDLNSSIKDSDLISITDENCNAEDWKLPPAAGEEIKTEESNSCKAAEVATLLQECESRSGVEPEGTQLALNSSSYLENNESRDSYLTPPPPPAIGRIVRSPSNNSHNSHSPSSFRLTPVPDLITDLKTLLSSPSPSTVPYTVTALINRGLTELPATPHRISAKERLGNYVEDNDWDVWNFLMGDELKLSTTDDHLDVLKEQSANLADGSFGDNSEAVNGVIQELLANCEQGDQSSDASTCCLPAEQPATYTSEPVESQVADEQSEVLNPQSFHQLEVPSNCQQFNKNLMRSGKAASVTSLEEKALSPFSENLRLFSRNPFRSFKKKPKPRIVPLYPAELQADLYNLPKGTSQLDILRYCYQLCTPTGLFQYSDTSARIFFRTRLSRDSFIQHARMFPLSGHTIIADYPVIDLEN